MVRQAGAGGDGDALAEDDGLADADGDKDGLILGDTDGDTEAL